MRQWRDSDADLFAEISADPQVMKYYPSPYTREQSDCLMIRETDAIAQTGQGYRAVERLDTGEFIGYIGLSDCAVGLPFSPCVEIGWRLAKAHWGMGFATEGAIESLRYGFDHSALDEVVSMTATINKPSENVMKKIGMIKAQSNFMHPKVSPDHPLCEHVLYSITCQQFYHYCKRK